MLDLAELDILLDKNLYWQALDDGRFAACTYANFTFEVVCHVERAELEKVHPLLPGTMHGFVDWERRTTGESYLPVQNLRIILRYLRGDGVTFTEPGGTEHAMMEVHSIHELPSSDELVWFTGKEYMFAQRKVDGVDLNIPVMVNDTNLAALKDDLETRYPGWLQRWAIGEELGVDTKELVRIAFNREPVRLEPPSLTDIGFD